MTFHLDCERRTERPYNRSEMEEFHMQDLRAIHDGEYQRALGAVCRAIQMTPIDLVDSAYFQQVLCSLSARAMEAGMPKVSESLDGLSDEVSQ